MSDPVVRAMAFYWQDRKAAEVNEVTVKFMMGREALYGQEGLLAYSKGAAKMQITFKEITPVGGSTTTSDLQKVLAQSDIDASFILAGNYCRQKMAVLEAEFTSNTEKGTTLGSYTLEGKKPEIAAG